MGDVPLVPGPVFGLRTWRIVRHDGPERLAAPQRGTPWTPGGWLEATCAAGHAAPAAGCGCGVHAWHPRSRSARRVLASRFDLPGIVEADGVVEVHADGFRAQRARPYAFLRIPARHPALVDRLARTYGAEVLDLRRPAELLAVCEARGLGLTEAVVAALLGPAALAEIHETRLRGRRRAAARLVAAALVAAALGAAGAQQKGSYGHAGSGDRAPAASNTSAR